MWTQSILFLCYMFPLYTRFSVCFFCLCVRFHFISFHFFVVLFYILLEDSCEQMNSENSKQSSNSVFLWFIFIIPFYFRSASQFYSIYDSIQEVLISPPISVYHLSFSSLPLMQRHIYSETSLETNHGLCILERTKMMSNVSMNERGRTLLCGRHPVCFFSPLHVDACHAFWTNPGDALLNQHGLTRFRGGDYVAPTCIRLMCDQNAHTSILVN